jgi:hypothetical protein
LCTTMGCLGGTQLGACGAGTAAASYGCPAGSACYAPGADPSAVGSCKPLPADAQALCIYDHSLSVYVLPCAEGQTCTDTAPLSLAAPFLSGACRPSAGPCGGFIQNPPVCTDGYTCARAVETHGLADVSGVCVK